MAKMKRRNKETKQKNEDEILDLRKENEKMKRKFMEGVPSVRPINHARRTFTSPPAL